MPYINQRFKNGKINVLKHGQFNVILEMWKVPLLSHILTYFLEHMGRLECLLIHDTVSLNQYAF